MGSYVIAVKRIYDILTGEKLKRQVWEYAYDDILGDLYFSSIKNARMFDTPEEAESWFERYRSQVDWGDYNRDSIGVKKIGLKTVKKL